MKKSLKIFCMIVFCVIVFGCLLFVYVKKDTLFSKSEKDTYTVNGFTCDSLSKVMGENQKRSSSGSGVFLGGNYGYVIFSFDDNDKRDSAATQYILYLKGTLGFSDLTNDYTYDIGSQSGTKHYIFVQYGNKTEDKTINIGIDDSRNKALEIIILVASLQDSDALF